MTNGGGRRCAASSVMPTSPSSSAGNIQIRPWVTAELSIAREVGTRYFLLRGRSGRPCARPAQALRTDEMHTWNWPNLRNLIYTR